MKKYFSSYWIRSAFYTILQRFSLTLFGLVNFILLIQALLPKPQMGVWALFLLITTIFETTKTNLLKNAHIKYVTGSTESQEKTAIASSSLVINASISSVFILFVLFFSNSLSYWLHTGTELAATLRWFIPGLVFMIFFSHLEAIQQSHLDFKGVFAGYFVRQVLFFAAVVAHTLLKLPVTLPQLAVYQSISIFFGTLTLYFYSRQYLYYRFDPTRAWIRRILGYGGYIFGSGTIANIYQNLDQLMIAKYMLPVHVAGYNAASRINTLVDIPSYAASEVLFPKVSQASAQEGANRVKYLYEKMVAILLSFTTPVAIFIIFFPRLIISLIAGSQYIEAAPILQLYMITGILRPAQNQAANILNSIGKPKLCFFINAGYLAVNLVVNYICLIHLQYYGAAIGTLITFSLGSVVWYFVMRKEIKLELKNIFVYAAGIYKFLYTFISGYVQKKTRKNQMNPQPSIVNEGAPVAED